MDRIMKAIHNSYKRIVLIMDTRDKEVLNMQFTLIPILAKAWNKSYSDLSDMFMN